MKTCILAITTGGKSLAGRLAAELENTTVVEASPGVHDALAAHWDDYEGIICIMAAGIVVRGLASLMRDKSKDPCVLVLDEKGAHVVSLLSGHLGGGNELAARVAVITGGRPVITTASDALGLTALDVWARSQNLVPSSRTALTAVSAKLVNSRELRLFSEVAIESLPPGLREVANKEEADIIVSNRTDPAGDIPLLHPRNLVVGIGCNRNTPAAELQEALDEFLEGGSFARLSVRNLGSIDLKQDEAGLLELAGKHGWKIDFFTKEELNRVRGITPSEAVRKATGARGVAEPAALLSAGTDTLLLEKRKWPNVTLALARAPFTLSAQALEA